jgi:hypothetical protein
MPLLLFIINLTCLTKVIVFCGLTTIYSSGISLWSGREGRFPGEVRYRGLPLRSPLAYSREIRDCSIR